MQLAESLSSAQSANEMREIGNALSQQISHKLELTNRRISDQFSYLRRERENALGKVRLLDLVQYSYMHSDEFYIICALHIVSPIDSKIDLIFF